MNLSPARAEVLAEAGHETSHWSALGEPAAPDTELLLWARAHGAVLLTCDLDSSAILASSRSGTPSVVQLRTADVLPGSAAEAVVEALDRFSDDLTAGALVTIDARRLRVRVLPLS